MAERGVGDDFETDVVVVGGGGSGLAAALSAAEHGARVVVVEKNPQLGGTTGLSIGSITAARTPHQRRAGIEDSPDEHFEDMAAFAGDLASRDNLALRRILVDNVTDTLAWLMGLGLRFFGPMPEPPHRKPRMHNVLPNSRAYIHYLGRACRRAGVEVRTGARVQGFEREGERVVGVRVATNGREATFRGRRGVILATGDYSNGRELKARYAPELADVGAVNPASTGDGQMLGIELGSEVLNGDLIGGPHLRFQAPENEVLVRRLPPSRLLSGTMAFAMHHLPSRVLRPFVLSFMTTYLAPEASLFREGAIMVNGRGERFTDELGLPAADVPAQPGHEAYIVFDERLARQFSEWPYFVSTAPGVAYAYVPDYLKTRKDVSHGPADLEGLARRTGLPAEPLGDTIKRCNAERDNGGGLEPLSPPFYALGPVRSWVVLTEGGLKVSERHEVLKADGAVVPGLYAVGSAGQGGLLLEGHGHHLGWAFTSGRRAGRFAAGADAAG